MQLAGPIDPQELEAFLDALLEAGMAEHQIPGVVVAVVQDGRSLLAKGYGYADLDAQVPVDPERTLFRIGSVSKLFTWSAGRWCIGICCCKFRLKKEVIHEGTCPG